MRLPLSGILAWSVFIFSTTVAVLSYARIRQLEVVTNSVPFAWAETKQQYLLKGQGACLTAVETNYQHSADGTEFKTNADLRFKLQGRAYAAKFSLEASFNKFFQLGGAVLRIVGDNWRIVIASKDVNPIQIVVQSSLADAPIFFRSTLEGPIELKRLSPGQFSLNYHHFQKLSTSYAPLLQQPIFQSFNFKLEPAPSVPQECLSGSLDLQPLVQSLGFLLNGLQTQGANLQAQP
jgi:hypothetical protein